MDRVRPNRVRWMAWALCVLPLGALADQPAAPTNTVSDSALAPDTGSPGADGTSRAAHHRPTDAEWRDASTFLDQYIPKRMALVRDLPEPRRQRLRTIIYDRYLALLKVRESFPQIYQVELQRLTIEDNLFDLHRQFTSASAPQKPALRAQLRQQVQSLFENTQQDRQTRITRMNTWVADLQTKMAQDNRNRETVIDQQLKEVIQHGPENLGKEMKARRNPNNPSPASPGDTTSVETLPPPATTPSN